MLELDRRVVNAEIAQESLLHVAQDALADRGRNVLDRNVAGQSMGFRSDAPDVEIVNVVHSRDRADRQFDLLQLHAARRAFEQDVESLADDAESRPQDEHADPDRKNRVDPVIAREQDGPAARDDRGSRERIADFVQQGAADVHVSTRTIEQKRDGPVHNHACRGDPHHHTGVDMLGVLQSLEGLVENKERDADQRGGIEQGNQHPSAMVAIGFRRTRGT